MLQHPLFFSDYGGGIPIGFRFFRLFLSGGSCGVERGRLAVECVLQSRDERDDLQGLFERFVADVERQTDGAVHSSRSAASFSSPSPGWSIQRRNCVWSSPGTSLCRNLPMSSLICRLSIVCGLYPGYAFINKTAWRGATPTRQRFFSYFFGRRLRTGVFGARFQTKRARSVSSRRSWLRAAVMWRSTVLTLRLSRSAISLLESSS